MNTEYFESLARLTPALHDTDCDFSARGGHRALRAEAVRQVRWLQRAWARTLPPIRLARPASSVPPRVRDARTVRMGCGRWAKTSRRGSTRAGRG